MSDWKPGLMILLGAASLCQGGDWKLWYRQPAAQWEQALPVGNGWLGAMVFGSLPREHIQLNEQTLWSGTPRASRANRMNSLLLKRQRELIFAGRYEDAEKLRLADIPGSNDSSNQLELAGTSGTRHAYQTLGDLYLHFPQGTAIEKDYRRELDMDTAIAVVSYRAGDAIFTEEVFANAPDRVLVVRLTCDKPGRLSFLATMDRPTDVRANQDRYATGSEFDLMEKMQPPPPARLTVVAPDRAKWSGQASDDGAAFRGQLRLLAEGGQVVRNPAGLELRGANAATILFSAATDFQGRDPERASAEAMAAAEKRPYAELRRRHVSDHQKLFRRVDLNLGSNDAVKLPTDKRLRAYQLDTQDNRVHYAERDPQLFALYFQYGRYLMIASSRPGGLPPALQGLWNDSLLPPWFGQHTSDINVQMNFWPVEVANLSECHLPLLDLLETFKPAMEAAARESFGARGYVLCGMTNYGPKTGASTWQDAAGWLAQDFWEHYAFSGDREYLARRAWPFLKQASLFYLDFLTPHPKNNGWLVTGPAYSPENMFLTPERKKASLSVGTTMSLGVIRDLFGNTIEAGRILNVDPELLAQLQAALQKLAPYQVGRNGQLQEWLEDFTEAEPGNRHNSHLLPLFPGKSITPRGTPDLAKAARSALEGRISHNGGWTGWSRAWMLNLAARLEDGNLAREQLTYLLRRCTFDNLFDAHPRRGGQISIFQIDGNFGGTAGIAEILLQSHAGEISLLPALPREWPAGHVNGLRARGGFEVDQAWSKGKLQSVTIRSRNGGPCRLRYKGKTAEFATEAGNSYRVNGELKQL